MMEHQCAADLFDLQRIHTASAVGGLGSATIPGAAAAAAAAAYVLQNPAAYWGTTAGTTGTNCRQFPYYGKVVNAARV